MGLFGGGLALGGHGAFAPFVGGVALGGDGSFALVMPLPVCSAQAFAFGPVAANVYTPVLPFFWQVNKNGDGVNFMFAGPPFHIVMTPLTPKLYEFEATVLFTAAGLPPAVGVDYVEVILTDGVLVYGQGMAYFEQNVLWGPGQNYAAGNGYWAVVILYGVINQFITAGPNLHLEIKSTKPGYIDQAVLGPGPSVSNWALDWSQKEICDYP